MEKKSSLLLKAFIDRSYNKESLFSYFPKEESAALRALPLFPHFSFPSLLSHEKSLPEYHYSWFALTLRSMSQEKQALFLSLFDARTAQKIQQLLGSSLTIPSLSPMTHAFLLQEFKKESTPKELLPIELLKETELFLLLTLTKEQLLHLIDLLGIYDLAADIRQIVDKSLLTQIAQTLSVEQRQFLQYASKQSLHYLPKRLRIQEIIGDRNKVNRLLHQRGMARLAAALVDEERDFLWHLSHKLDTGRAALLEKMKEEMKEVGLTTIFKRQASSLAKRISAHEKIF